MKPEGETPPAGDNVVALTDLLRREFKPVECEHVRLGVDERNRRVECRDCQREVDPLAALLIITDRAKAYQLRFDQMRTDMRNLADWVPRRRAVRALESMWSGRRLPLCPHCKRGVTADGLASMGWVNKAYAEALEREEAAGRPRSAEVVHLAPAADPEPDPAPSPLVALYEGMFALLHEGAAAGLSNADMAGQVALVAEVLEMEIEEENGWR